MRWCPPPHPPCSGRAALSPVQSAGDRPLQLITAPTPAQRAQERADLARHYEAGEVPEPPRFLPADEMYVDETGCAATNPKAFLGTLLCEKWRVEEYINQGTYGRGWVATDIETERRVFLKTFRSRLDQAGTNDECVRREAMALLHPDFPKCALHPNIVKNELMYGTVQVRDRIVGSMFFVQSPELCEWGELRDYLCPSTPPYVRTFPEPLARRIVADVANGLAHLHQHGCYHRDLKLENLVVSSDMRVMIMDYGSCKFADQVTPVTIDTGEVFPVTTTLVGIGTDQVKAPEVRLGTSVGATPGYDPAAMDVWSLGCITFFLTHAAELHDQLRSNCFNFFTYVKLGRPGFHELIPRHNGDAEWDAGTGAPKHTRLFDRFRAVAASPELKTLLAGTLNWEVHGPRGRWTIERVLEAEWFRGERACDGAYAEAFRSRSDRRVQTLRLGHRTSEQVVEAVAAALSATAAADFLRAGSLEVSIDATTVRVAQSAADGRGPHFTIEAQPGGGKCTWLRGNITDWLSFMVLLREGVDKT